ncbi:MAG: FHA domain-containing protein [Bacteroidales bacterium]
MKKIACPRCDNFIRFDDSNYTEGQSIRLHCEHCGRNMSIRISRKAKNEPIENLGQVEVFENEFGYKQDFPLVMGDNIIGRRSKGTIVQVPILTDDMSMDRQHCVVHIKRDKAGKLIYTVRDFPSLVGTFYKGEYIAKNERVVLHNDTFLTLGATTIMVRLPEEAKNEDED